MPKNSPSLHGQLLVPSKGLLVVHTLTCLDGCSLKNLFAQVNSICYIEKNEWLVMFKQHWHSLPDYTSSQES